MAVMTRGRSAITGYMFGADIADGKMPNAETVYSSEQDRSRHQARTAVVRRRYQRDDGTWHSATHSAATIAVGTIAVRTRARRRGAGRPAARSGGTSTSSQDPGSGSDEPEPPDSGRLCAAPWCRHHVDGTRKVYCGTERCTQARAAERQRKHRNGDLTPVELERLADARLAGYVGGEAFAKSGEHSRSFLW